MERKLAVILAADVAGYSRLMGADEEAIGDDAVTRWAVPGGETLDRLWRDQDDVAALYKQIRFRDIQPAWPSATVYGTDGWPQRRPLRCRGAHKGGKCSHSPSPPNTSVTA